MRSSAPFLVPAVLATVAAADPFLHPRQANDELFPITTTTESITSTETFAPETAETSIITRSVTDDSSSTSTSDCCPWTRTSITTRGNIPSGTQVPLTSSCYSTFTNLMFAEGNPPRPTLDRDSELFSWYEDQYSSSLATATGTATRRGINPLASSYWASSSFYCSQGYPTGSATTENVEPTPTGSVLESQYSAYTSSYYSWRSQVSPTVVAAATQCANVENGYMARYMLQMLADDYEGCIKAANLEVPEKKEQKENGGVAPGANLGVIMAGGVAAVVVGAIGLL
ncbi:hypothetical protein QBC35DRAFT_507897 [Podospora australis]|uniref:Infection structure specific protein n=1 Tax=Podospora australis TaxID=1536484 RepID=A0AAN6WKK0_9PEZI|nr:hypothetical protein QBC35DRAFT_507897 [Podospora australis]